jgi:hypothetical protein
MPRHTTAGDFYEFHRDQPFREIGLCVTRVRALWRVRHGGDVYTPAASDASSLAKDVSPGAAQWHGAHEWNYFPHYYPAFNNEFGHVFYGERGYREGEMQRGPGEERR